MKSATTCPYSEKTYIILHFFSYFSNIIYFVYIIYLLLNRASLILHFSRAWRFRFVILDPLSSSITIVAMHLVYFISTLHMIQEPLKFS
jgi:hypothetical protein